MDPSVDPDLVAHLLTLELALARRDLAALPGGPEAVIDDDFVEFGASGRRWDRAATLAALRDAPSAAVAIEDLTTVSLGDDVVLALYRLRGTDRDAGRRASLRSSVWVRRDGRWRLRFHQGTPAAD